MKVMCDVSKSKGVCVVPSNERVVCAYHVRLHHLIQENCLHVLMQSTNIVGEADLCDLMCSGSGRLNESEHVVVHARVLYVTREVNQSKLNLMGIV
jgi:hypothetical protein